MNARARLVAVFSVASLTGVSAIFLPFAWDGSPMRATCSSEYGLWKFGAPFFLAILILGTSLHWIISGTLSKLEKWIAYIISISVVCLTLSLFITSPPSDFSEWLMLLATIITLAIGVFLVIRSLKIEKLKQFSPIMAMQTAYLGNCVLCLLAFRDGLEIGAYCALVTAVLYATQMIIISIKKEV